MIPQLPRFDDSGLPMLLRPCPIDRYYGWIVVCWCAITGPPCMGQIDRYAAARAQLVAESIVGGGIRDVDVIEAIRTVPRHEFIDRRQRHNAYYDMAIPIGEGQTISPPYVVAFMTEALQPKKTDRVLEIGTGSGYQAAVLSGLVKDVYTIEIVESLGKRAERTFRRLVGFDNVHLRIGDGYLGWPEEAPFQKIIVTCSPESIPQPLIDQLDEGGRMVVPMGERFQQVLYLFRKTKGKLEKESLQPTFFVPMTGQAESERERPVDEAVPHLQHTSFETTLPESDLPAGWFYARQVEASSAMGSTKGDLALVCQNDEVGRPSHAMQAFGVDGREVRQLRVVFEARGDQLAQGRSPFEQASVIVDFYGDHRGSVGSKTIAGMTGTFDWKEKTATIRVPTDARLAIVGIGLFGGTGKLAVDDLRIRPIVAHDSRGN